MYTTSRPAMAGPSITDWIGAVGTAAGQLFGPKPAAPAPIPVSTGPNYMPLILVGGGVLLLVVLLKRKKSAA